MTRRVRRTKCRPSPTKPTLDRSIASATGALLDLQQPDGHWVFELEADATIPAEYVLLRHYLGEPVDQELEAKIGAYLRRDPGRQHGGWPLFHGGAFDMSASVKAYFALKMIGDDPEAPHMRRARDAILAHPGGAARCNVFTRALLALYGLLPWRSVPVMPVEIMLLPRWFPFHLDKISYWARTVIVPLLVLMALKPRAKNPRGVRIDELFEQPPESVGPPKRAPHQKRGWFAFFAAVDRVLRAGRALLAEGAARSAPSTRAVALVGERLNGEDGLGAIFPAMANSVMMFDVLGYPPDHPQRAIGAPLDRQAAGGAGGRGLLPALRLADLGHRARLPRADGSRRRTRAGADAQGARLAGAQADSGRGGRLGRAAARTCGRAAGRSSTPTRTIPMSTTPRWWRWRWIGRRAQVPAAISRRRSRAPRNGSIGMQSRNGGWGAFDADNEYLLPQQHPVRRPRRAARSADRRRDGALPRPCWRSLATRRDTSRPWRAPSTICAAPRCRTAAGTAAGA